MKKFLILTAVFALIPVAAFAGNSTTAGASSGAYSQSGVNIGSATPIGTAFAPGLSASGLSCSGSASIGGAGAGWGLSLGITKEDKACNAREDAKYIHGVTGDMGAAKERLCAMPENRAAFLRAGHPCSADLQRVNYAQRTTVRKSFKNMKACRAYAAKHPGVSCRAK